MLYKTKKCFVELSNNLIELKTNYFPLCTEVTILSLVRVIRSCSFEYKILGYIIYVMLKLYKLSSIYAQFFTKLRIFFSS